MTEPDTSLWIQKVLLHLTKASEEALGDLDHLCRETLRILSPLVGAGWGMVRLTLAGKEYSVWWTVEGIGPFSPTNQKIVTLSELAIKEFSQAGRIAHGELPSETEWMPFRSWIGFGLEVPSAGAPAELCRSFGIFLSDRKTPSSKTLRLLTILVPMLESFLALWLSSHALAIDPVTGFLHFDGFRRLLDRTLFSLNKKRGEEQWHLAVISLEGLSSESGIAALPRRDARLAMLADRIRRHLPESRLKSVSVRDELYLFSPSQSGSDPAKSYLGLLERLRHDEAIRTWCTRIKAGIALFPQDGTTVDELVKNSRLALMWVRKDQSHDVAVVDHAAMSLVRNVEGFYWTDSEILNYRNIGLILDAIETVRLSYDPPEMERSIVDKAIEVTGAERGMLLMLDPAGKLSIRRGRLAGQRDLDLTPDISWSVPNRVIETGLPANYLTLDQGDLPAAGKSIQLLQLLSVMCTPLVVREKVIGVLYVDSRRNRSEFADADLTFFQVLGKQMGIMLEVAHLFQENEAKQREIESLNVRLRERIDEQNDRMIDLEKEIASSRSRLAQQFSFHNIVGSSPQMREMFSLIDRIAPHQFPVLIEGESGTGKELVARAIHAGSLRANQRFVSENCGAIPDTLFEAELFGHEKGAFTGADRDKIGLVRMAEGGTLFLDEVANMSDAMQKGILRVLQEQEVRPVGGKKTVRVDVRLICSSNIPLMDLVDQGRFRRDLFYRLNGITLRLPPLRERKEDIPLLVKHFLDKTAAETHGPRKRLPASLLDILVEYDWPGNVRELDNEIKRVYILSKDQLSSAFLSPYILARRKNQLRTTTEPTTSLSLRDNERELIVAALKSVEGRKKQAAELLGISRTSLYQKLLIYDIRERRDY